MTRARRPSLLFLFSDQHTQNVAGCYGDPAVETPNLDRLAARGVVFDNAYCPSPICVPSRMSMLTGAPSVRAGLLDQRRLPRLRSADVAARARRGRLRAGADRAPARDGPGPAARLRPSARSATTARTGAASPATTWACSTGANDPTPREPRALRPRPVRVPGEGHRRRRRPPADTSTESARGARAGDDDAVLPDRRLHAAASALRRVARGLRALRRSRAAAAPCRSAGPAGSHPWLSWWRENRGIAGRRRAAVDARAHRLLRARHAARRADRRRC